MTLSEKNRKVSEITGLVWCPSSIYTWPLDFTSDTGFARLVEWTFKTDKLTYVQKQRIAGFVFFNDHNIRLALIDAVIQAEGGEK